MNHKKELLRGLWVVLSGFDVEASARGFVALCVALHGLGEIPLNANPDRRKDPKSRSLKGVHII